MSCIRHYVDNLCASKCATCQPPCTGPRRPVPRSSSSVVERRFAHPAGSSPGAPRWVCAVGRPVATDQSKPGMPGGAIFLRSVREKRAASRLNTSVAMPTVCRDAPQCTYCGGSLSSTCRTWHDTEQSLPSSERHSSTHSLVGHLRVYMHRASQLLNRR